MSSSDTSHSTSRTPKAQAWLLLMEHPERELVSGAYIERLHPEKPGTVIMSTYQYLETARRREIGSRISGGRKDAGWELSLFEVDIKTGKGRMIESGTPYTDDWILDTAGRSVARTEWNPESRRYSILAKQGEGWQTIFSAEIDYEFDVVGLAADGKSLLARSPRGSDRFKIWSIPLSGGEPVLAYEHPDFDVTSVIFDRFSNSPAGYWIGGPRPTVVWTDPKAGIDPKSRRQGIRRQGHAQYSTDPPTTSALLRKSRRHPARPSTT